ncbi:hypothetical protein PQV03_10010 [Thermoanaerobacterium thermosaccharolyticum]|jgi:phage terminase Nu1 subunit (DNA packaging protein)|uniref:hypothetical protein n=1 Tax=Thermoanaerobacterium thermosaccharolyticum TaxID=1517 RepID=UPI003D2B89F6
MDKKVKILDDKICLSTTAMCEIFNIDKSTLKRWGDDGCPKAARGWWPLADVLRWRGLVSVGGIQTERDIERLSLQEQKLYYEAKYKQAQSEAAEFKNAIQRGEYILKDDIVAELQRFFVVLKRSMLGYSRRIATELAGYVDAITARRIEKMITELTLDALEQISIDGVYKPSKKKHKN